MTEFEIIEVVLKVSLLLSPSLLLLPFNTKAKRYLTQYERKIVLLCAELHTRLLVFSSTNFDYVEWSRNDYL